MNESNREEAKIPTVEELTLQMAAAGEHVEVPELELPEGAVPVIMPEPDMTAAINPALMYAEGSPRGYEPTPIDIGVGDVGDLGAVIGPIGALENNGQQAQVGQFHPAHALLDQIDTMVAFASDEVNHTVRDLVKKVRAML